MEFQNLSAYTCVTRKDLTDIGSTGYILRHKKTGARVMLIENEDENKVFNIVFRTTPTNSTGVPHIIEHTVLCGSQKYPSKDPFVELVKGSMNTFLNAMTYPDKTMFPVASCNDQDFKNLMDVYLDAVFHPNIYRNENIFRQEGWSWQIEDKDDPVVINGVVYNEMKGAFSSPDDVLERQIMNSLFPDTTYGVESGGDPEHIPELSYEEFLDFHRRYYNPSNAYIYLYGKMDFEERLAYLDREYLSSFEMAKEMGENGPVYSEVGIQKAFDCPREIRTKYPVAENDPLEDNAYLTWNVAVATSSDTLLANSFAALDYVLLDSPGAPLKMALLDAGIGKDVYGSYDSGIRQPVFSVVAKGANEQDEMRFRETVRSCLERLCEEGLNEKALEAAINTMEFKYREADFGGYPKGLIYSIDCFDSWLYQDSQPFDYLVQLADYKALREKIGTGYFENLIRTYILDNPHASFVTVGPQRGLAQEAEAKTARRLAQWKETLSEEQIEGLIEGTKALRAFQETPSTREELETIPMLSRSDLRKEALAFRNEEHMENGVKLVHHQEMTNGIAYITLLFDASGIAQEDLPYFGILRSVLGMVSTEHYTYEELANEIGRRTGGVSAGISMFPSMHHSDRLKAALGIQIATLPAEIDFSMEIAGEILFTSKLEDEKRLKEIIQKTRSRLYTKLTSAGHMTAATRAMSGLNAESCYSDAISGIAYYQEIALLEKEFDSRKAELIARLKRVLASLLRKEGFLISFTGQKEEIGRILQDGAKIREQLPGADAEPAGSRNSLSGAGAEPAGSLEQGGFLREITGLSYAPKSEGFLTPAKIQYVAQAGSFADAGLPYTGMLNVLRVIMNYEYLWTNLRVIGGAYGCGASFGRNGSSAFYSYRDPHLNNTLQVYRKVVEYLESFECDERDMTKYVIGTISGMDAPLPPRSAGVRSMTAYISGTTYEEIQAIRDQILAAGAEDIRSLAPYMEAILAKGAVCVVGNEEKIQASKELFDTVSAL